MPFPVKELPAALLVMLAHVPTFADTQTPEQAPTTRENNTSRTIATPQQQTQIIISPTFEARHAIPVSIKNASGRYSATAYEAGLSYFMFGEKENVAIFCDYSLTNTHFNGTQAAFGNHERVHFFARYERRIAESKWSLFADASLILSAEENASLGDGLIGRGGAGAKYTFSRNFDFSIGIMVMNRLCDSGDILPYCGFNWGISPYWSIRLTNGLVLSHDVFGDKMFRIDLAALYRGGDYRMADITVAGRRHARALETREFVLSLSVTKEFLNRACYVGAGLEGIFFPKYKFRSTGGSNIGEFECNPSIAFGLKAGFRF